MEIVGRIQGESQGTVQVFYDDGTGALIAALLSAVPEHGIQIILNWNQTQALLKVCEQVFESSNSYNPMYPPNHLWSDTGFHFMAPRIENPELFWFCFGALNCNVPSARVKVAFQDLKTVFERLGGFDRFNPDCHN